jgi:hypothetical protein
MRCFRKIGRSRRNDSLMFCVTAYCRCVGKAFPATCRGCLKVAHEVIGFFNRPNPSSRTMALGSTQPLPEMSTRNLIGSRRSYRPPLPHTGIALRYCRRREAVELFRFLLTPCSLVGTCSSVQNCTSRDCKDGRRGCIVN